MGELPIVTESGSFIINGAERVVVSQLHRSCALASRNRCTPVERPFTVFALFRIAAHGLKLNLTSMIFFTFYLDRRRRRRKFLITTFLRALLDWDPEKDKDSDQKIIELFYDIENLQIEDLLKKDNVFKLRLVEPMFDRTKGAVLAKAFEPLTKTYLRAKRLAKLN